MSAVRLCSSCEDAGFDIEIRFCVGGITMKHRKITALTAALTMIVSAASVMPVHAGAANYAADKQAKGTTAQIEKYLVLDKTATVPEAAFNFSIAAGDAVPYDGSETIAAYAGPDADQIVISEAVFTSTDTTVDGTADDGIANSTEKKYVKRDVSLDFTKVTFPEPGVYRYIITEEGAGDTDNLGAGISHAGNYRKTMDVYVTDDDNGVLSVAAYILYNSVIETAPELAEAVVAMDEKVDRTADDDAKTDGFVNEYLSQDLTFAKKVSGNQGSKDKYFKFTVTIANADGANLTIDTNASSFENEPTKNNATVYTADDMKNANSIDEDANVDGQQLAITGESKEYTFYLQNGQYITLLGLPKGAAYTVTEEAEEYTSKASDAESFTAGSFTVDAAVSGTVEDEDIRTGFTNDKSGLIPTGILLSVAAPACIGIAVLGGIVFLLIKGRKRRTEED